MKSGNSLLLINRCLLILTALFISITSLATYCHANDLKDGISIDENITKYEKLELDQNIRYIKLDAMSRARIKKRDINDMVTSGTNSGGDIAQGGVIVKPGAKTGDITVIYNGSNNTVVSGK
ncbi:hypothetical protein QUF75_17780 [Desulfococcaceae bacterium HSG7]|nr:hypothetical protein [Desulfococcaceae bacterium HSG7]